MDGNLSLFRDPTASNENLLLPQDMKVRDENLVQHSKNDSQRT
jgi:hypothetical protein